METSPSGDGRLVCTKSPTVERLDVQTIDYEASSGEIVVSVEVTNQNPYPVEVRRLMATVTPNKGAKDLICTKRVNIKLRPSESATHDFNCAFPWVRPVQREVVVDVSATPWE